MLEEKMSNWHCVSELINQQEPIAFGSYMSTLFDQSPDLLMHVMSYYKFALKLIGKEKRVLNVGCQEGFGTYLLGKECGFACGIDSNESFIADARRNFQDQNLEFLRGDLFNLALPQFDALVNFSDKCDFQTLGTSLQKVTQVIVRKGIAIMGMPNDHYHFTKRLNEEMRQHFPFVFLFASFGEIIQVGEENVSHAPYCIAIGCK